MRSVWIALGLFVTLWWTWVGFAVLYNRQGADKPAQRLLFLAGSVPAGVAAVAIEPASTGDSTVFAPSLAVTRLVLAAAYVVNGSGADLLRERIARACLISAGLFAISIAVPAPFRYALWAIAILVESGAMLRRGPRGGAPAAPRPRPDGAGARRPRRGARRAPLRRALRAVPDHPARRGRGRGRPASVDGHVATVGRWAALVAAMVLAAALWWLYFDSAAAINLRCSSSRAARRRWRGRSSRSATCSRRSRC